MTAVFDREAWLVARRQSIGASELAAVLGVSPYATAWDVWADKTNKLERWDGNEATKLGILFEKPVLDFAEQKLGQLDRNVVVRHGELPIASTLDAWAIDAKQPVEAKTAGLVGPLSHEWGEELTDQIPEHYLVQVHCQLMCTKAELGHLFALLPGRGVVHYQVEAKASLHEQIGNIVSDWWERHIVQGVEPDRELATYEVVKRMKRLPNKSVELTSDFDGLLQRRDELKAKIKEAEETLKQVDAELLASIGDAEEARLPSGRIVTYFEQSRKGYTVPDSTFRVLRVKKAKV